MLLKVGIRRVLCGWGRSSAAAEFTLNSKVLLWWCRQIRVSKKRPTLVHNEFCEKAFSKTSFKKEENNEINSNNGINTVTVSRLKGVLCYPNSSKLALEGASQQSQPSSRLCCYSGSHNPARDKVPAVRITKRACENMQIAAPHPLKFHFGRFWLSSPNLHFSKHPR